MKLLLLSVMIMAAIGLIAYAPLTANAQSAPAPYTEYYADGTIKFQILYHNNGSLKSETNYRTDGSINGQNLYDTDGIKKSYTGYYPDGTINQQNLYDDSGNLKGYNIYSPDGSKVCYSPNGAAIDCSTDPEPPVDPEINLEIDKLKELIDTINVTIQTITNSITELTMTVAGIESNIDTLNQRVDNIHREIPQAELPHKIYYTVQDYPTYTSTSYDNTQNALRESIKQWEAHNPQFDFIESTAPANYNGLVLNIEWNQFNDPDYVGLASCNYYQPISNQPNFCTLTITIGDFDCNDRFVSWDTVTFTDTISHEIGHAVGLQHNINTDHLMWGTYDQFTQIPFDDLGLNLPAGGYVGYYEDQFEIGQELQMYLFIFTELDNEITNEPDINKINELIDLYNMLVADQINKAEQFNCYPNVSN